MFGGQQSDAVSGFAGANQVYGNKQNDIPHYGLGDYSLFGRQNDDVLLRQVLTDSDSETLALLGVTMTLGEGYFV